jgi:hypothetical protein
MVGSSQAAVTPIRVFMVLTALILRRSARLAKKVGKRKAATFNW